MEASDLPFEVVVMILLMLPTSVLVRFQCVCRTWYNLIRDPFFVMNHLVIVASRGDGYLLRAPLECWSDRVFSLLHDQTFDLAVDMEVPPELAAMNFIVIGSFNGVLCVASMKNYGNTIYLYNPSIRRCMDVSHPVDDDVRALDGGDEENFTLGLGLDVNIALGFGYYGKVNDYKIVKIVFGSGREGTINNDGVEDCHGSVESRVDVYSTVCKTWKNIQVEYFPWTMVAINSEAVVNDSIHWKVIFEDTYEDVIVILAFHMGSETFQQMLFPNYEVDGEDLVDFLGVFKERLALFTYNIVDQYPLEEKCHLWVMMDYGVDASWTKTHSIVVDHAIATPLLFTKNDEIIYDDGEDDLVVCDFNNQTTRPIGYARKKGYINLVPYMNSLVLLDG